MMPGGCFPSRELVGEESIYLGMELTKSSPGEAMALYVKHFYVTIRARILNV
jgi:hypothetical protein